MDILNADLVLFRDVEKWGKAKKYRRKRVVKRKKDVENDTGFHFVAYVPIDGAVWKLDGLQRQPDNLGADLWLYQLISRAN
jgi:ubiquitin carboxyl-terminal hydrolase L5